MNHRPGRSKRLVVALAAGALGAGVLPLSAASAAVDSGAFCVNVPAENPFSDVQASDVHYDNILCLSATGITQGKTDGTYAPGEGTSRGQMASFIARFIDTANDLELTDLNELPASGDDAFPDDDGNTHEDAINRLAAAGIVEGKTDGNYNPDETVNRSQMASYIVRAIEFLTGEDLPAGDDAFPDDDDSLHEANIDKLAAAEIVEGKTDGTYAPGEPVNRAQMASYIVRALSVLHADGDIKPAPAPPTAGPITLDATTVAQGGTVTGTIGNPTTIENASVSGCGLSLTDLSVNGATGAFSFKLPPDFSGDCVLAFAASWTDGSSTNQAFEVSIVGADDDITDSPDLVASTYSPGTNQVLFHFDEDVTSVLPGTFGNFHVYGINGVALSAIDADILPSNPRTVIATFPLNWGPALGSFATRAGLDKDTVEDAEGNINYPDFAPLVNQKPGITIAPDLVSVDNIRTDSLSRIVADFTFDQAVNTGTLDWTQFYLAEKSTAPQQAGAVAPGLFEGRDLIDWSDDSRTVTIQFGSTAAAPTPNTSQIVRGIVEEDAVQGTAFPQAWNVLQVEEACVGGGPVGTCTPVTASDGTATGKTDTPDIVSAVVGGNNSLRITFDEPVDADDLEADAFIVYDADLTPNMADDVLRSATDTKVIDVDFDDPITNAVILTIEDNDNDNSGGPGVLGTTGEQLYNIDDEVAIGASPAGTTALADLLGVTAKQLPNGGWVVEYKFDAPPAPAGPLAGGGQFYLVDPEGTHTPNTGGVVAGNSVFITTDDTTAIALGLPVAATGFDVSDIEDSTIGAVDEIHFTFNPTFTEGEATLVKTPLP